ncbi:MAG: phage/plasmid primase, P4 family [Methanotrichaceae archaeon]|nr:phage/plasmid primase, P4 family [Methanotrichaceae archaeon]
MTTDPPEEPQRAITRLNDCIVLDEKSGTPKTINYDLTARWVLQDNHVAYLIETENTLIYRDGVYEDFAEIHLQKVLFDAFEPILHGDGRSLIRKSDVNEVMERVNVWSLKNISEFECNQHVFNVSNGILNLDTYELMPHSPDWMQLSKSPSKYDPEAKCPTFMEFLDQALEPQYHDLIGEFIGYVLWPQYHIHKAFMFLGEKRTGKGTLIRAIEAAVGKDDCSHVSLQDLMGHRFMRARLFGKKLNSYGDLPATPIADAGIFKNVTGEDTIDAENKFEHPFSFKNAAKLVFSANKLPMLRVPDDAFYGRWIIIPFGNSVYGKEDPDLTAKLTTTEELSGILNFGIEGLKRLRANGWNFTYEDKASEIYRKKSNPIIGFLEDRCEASSDGYVIKADLIVEYNKYAEQNRFPPATSRKAFGKEIMDQTAIPVETFHPKVDERQVEAWRGIKLKETA